MAGAGEGGTRRRGGEAEGAEGVVVFSCFVERGREGGGRPDKKNVRQEKGEPP
jgi:hypothetical protein